MQFEMIDSNGAKIPLIRNVHDLDEFFHQYASLVIALNPTLENDSEEDATFKIENNKRAVKEMVTQLSERILTNSDFGYFLAIFKIDRFMQDYIRK